MTDPKIIDLNDERSASEGEPDIQLEDCERTRCEVWTRVMGYHYGLCKRDVSSNERSTRLDRITIRACYSFTRKSVRDLRMAKCPRLLKGFSHEK